jgi:hypothetical protein
MPLKGSDGYQVPNPEQIAAMDSALYALIDSKNTLALTEAAAFGYRLCEGAGDEAGIVLGEPVEPGTGQARFLWRRNPARGFIIGAPHPLYDSATLTESVALFEQVGARLLVVSGTHRCANAEVSACDGTTSTCDGTKNPFRQSDMAHVTLSLFQAVHQRFIDTFPDDWVLSVHGMAADGISLSTGAGGETGETTAVGRIYKAFAVNYPEAYVTSCNAFDGAVVDERLCGTTNTQGRHVNGSESPCTESASFDSGRFVHLEQSKVFRNDPSGVAAVLQLAWDAP